jgi:Xaa-Pro aminopeptidase
MASLELAFYLVPRVDEHLNSYCPPSAERLAWLTGFTGSAGLAVIGATRAALFVDGRYTIAAAAQTGKLLEQQHLTNAPPEKWLDGQLGPSVNVGFDPRLHTPDGLAPVRKAVEAAGGRMVEAHLIDELWTDRPSPPSAPVECWPERFAGASAADKRARIGEALRKEKLDAAVLSSPESVAWLLNIRGGDVAVTPIALGFAIVHADGATELYMDGRKLGADVRTALDGVRIEELDALAAGLARLAGRRVRVDAVTGNAWIHRTLGEAGATVDPGPDPCALPRACKNAAELAGIRAAHVRDGAALTRLLHWCSRIEPGRETEWTVAAKALELRRGGEHFRSLSFSTIAAVGPNAAIPHYAVSEASALPVDRDVVLLVDSGAQYLDGTTDVTRTLAIGRAADLVRRRYTQVLKGHIALANARFPEGTTGTQLDALARQFLWADGVDFDHGTGHGVGCFLAVHEGPHGISKRPNKVGLEPGMIVSDEPGYYKAGDFGIRVENLIAVREVEAPAGAEMKLFGFETLTLAPYDRALIDVALLTPGERAWIDDYHATVRATLTPLLDGDVRAWLAAATEPL